MNVLVAVYSEFAVWNIPEAHVDRLRREFPHHTFHHARSEADVDPLMPQTEIAFTSELRPRHLAAAPALRWVHSPAAGVGSMLFPEMVASPVVISNSRGMSAVQIAEQVIGATIALFRKFPLAWRSQMQRHWAQDEALAPPPLRTIDGARVLLFGLGTIGAACAARFAALGAEVSAVRRRPELPVPAGVTRACGPEAFSTLLADADILVITAAHTHATRHIIGAAELARMKPEAILVNVSRGKLIDESALADALARGIVAGAALDVFEHEPLDRDSPLWTLPTVIITPHTAGFRADHWDAATDLFAENLRRWDRGEALVNVVDKRQGY